MSNNNKNLNNKTDHTSNQNKAKETKVGNHTTGNHTKHGANSTGSTTEMGSKAATGAQTNKTGLEHGAKDKAKGSSNNNM